MLNAYLKSLLEKKRSPEEEASIALGECASLGNMQQAVELINKQGADVHYNNEAAIRIAAAKGHLGVTALLISEGADVHVNEDEPVRLASENGHLDVVVLLVNEGADLSAMSNFALTMAERNRHMDVVGFIRR